jgi:hypothetical protein
VLSPFRKLAKLLDEIAPGVSDAIAHNVNAVLDVLGLFTIPVALTSRSLQLRLSCICRIGRSSDS